MLMVPYLGRDTGRWGPVVVDEEAAPG